MEFKVQEIAEMLKGTVQGNEGQIVSKLTKIEDGEKNGLTFLFNPKYIHHLQNTEASAVVISKDLLPKEHIDKTLIIVPDAYKSFVKLLELYDTILKSNVNYVVNEKAEIHHSVVLNNNIAIGAFVVIEENVEIGKNVQIYSNVFIGKNSSIADGTIIYSGVNIYSDTKIGKNCVIHSGVVIGSDGFGFMPNEKGEFKKIPQTGNVVIGNDVEIGSNSTIDRATLGSTIIKNGVKLDNQIQIGHNVEIKENTVIASQTGIAGSTKIGGNVIIGGQVGIAGHLIIPDGIQIQAKSGVNSSPKKEVKQLYGSPAFQANEYKKAYVYFRKLPQIVKKIEELEKKLSKE